MGLKVINWPARSPDLNTIENMWSIMARGVYANGKQYDTPMELQQAILDAWGHTGRGLSSDRLHASSLYGDHEEKG